MYENKRAQLQMNRNYLMHDFFDDQSYDCTVVEYDEKKDRIILVSLYHPIHLFSLDSLYRCRIEDGEYLIEAEGVIVERYQNKMGDTVVFDIKKGLYKKPIK